MTPPEPTVVRQVHAVNTSELQAGSTSSDNQQPTLAVPERFMHVRYDGSRFPGGPGVEGLQDGANCQQFAYELLRHFGKTVPDVRSSDLWVDETFTVRVEKIAPLDLLFFAATDDAWGAHLGVYLGDGKVVHLSVRAGSPEIWTLDQFRGDPRYCVLLGAKRAKCVRESLLIPYVICTERLIVRCWEESDAGALKEAIDSSLEHLRRWMPWAHYEPEPVEKKHERIVQKRADFLQGREFTFGVLTQEYSRLVGTCSINFRANPEVANFGYWLRADEQGKGYVSEAVGGLTLASFNVLQLPVAEIYCNLLNERSAAVPRRLGFRKLDGEHVRKTADGKDRPSQVWRLNARELKHTPMATHRIAIQNPAGETLWKK